MSHNVRARVGSAATGEEYRGGSVMSSRAGSWPVVTLPIAVLGAAVLLGGCGKGGATGGSPAAPGPGPDVALRVWLPCGLAEWVGKFDGLVGPAARGPRLE